MWLSFLKSIGRMHSGSALAQLNKIKYTSLVKAKCFGLLK